MTGVILAGGKATRFSGINKSFIEVKSLPIIERQLEIFRRLFDEIIIVTNDPAPYLKYGTVVVSDLVKGKGPLGGIYTALNYAKSDKCFIAACDMPFLSEKLISHMMKNIGRGWIFTPERESGDNPRYEPMHSIYSKKCLSSVRKMVMSDKLKISHLFEELRAKVLTIDEAKMFDPELVSFKNINSSADLEGFK